MKLVHSLPVAVLLVTGASSAIAAVGSTCITTVACIVGQNSSTGASSDIGVEGLSAHGFGLVGVTSANPATSAARVAGLYGKDQGPGPYNSGISGFSQNGTGLEGFGVNGSGVVGLTGASSTVAQAGVAGYDDGTNSINTGVAGFSTNAIGVLAASANGSGIYSQSTNSDAIDGYSEGGGVALSVAGGSVATAGQVIQIQTVGPGDMIDGFSGPLSATPALKFKVDASGNEFLAGNLTTSAGTYARTRTSSGVDVASYGARSASPTLEDFGHGILRQGAAHIYLDPTFATTINTRDYLVFITPHGDSHGLYTSVPSASGFDVRENEQGKSTLTFDYRIVGQPIDMANAGHLPAMQHVNEAFSLAHAHVSPTRFSADVNAFQQKKGAVFGRPRN
jgi:hypothetical protein